MTTRSCFFLLLAMAGLAIGGCRSTLTGADGGGAACSGDTDCRSGQYCLGFTQACAGEPSEYTVGVGTCHRDCSAGACTCTDAADCRPPSACNYGKCLVLPILCAFEPSSCPAGCVLDYPTDTVCGPVCRCATCPALDASGQGGGSGQGGASGQGGTSGQGGSSGTGGSQGADAGMTCSPPCGSGSICVASGIEGGALILANDAGVCPSGTHSSGFDNGCERNLAYGCAPIPTACGTTVTCACAATLCTAPEVCGDPTNGVLSCIVEAP